MTSEHDQAIFEAAIKLGALYHQWVGTPISPETAETIEAAIEQSVMLQPFVTSIRVRLDKGLMKPHSFGYSELQGLMYNVEITTEVGRAGCRARLRPKGDYPLMEIVECYERSSVSNH
jgi:hypothetical protein